MYNISICKHHICSGRERITLSHLGTTPELHHLEGKAPAKSHQGTSILQDGGTPARQEWYGLRGEFSCEWCVFVQGKKGSWPTRLETSKNCGNPDGPVFVFRPFTQHGCEKWQDSRVYPGFCCVNKSIEIDEPMNNWVIQNTAILLHYTSWLRSFPQKDCLS